MKYFLMILVIVQTCFTLPGNHDFESKLFHPIAEKFLPLNQNILSRLHLRNVKVIPHQVFRQRFIRENSVEMPKMSQKVRAFPESPQSLSCSSLKAFPNRQFLNPCLSSVTNVFNLVVNVICDPVTTVLNLGWEFYIEESKPVDSFVKWQNKMGINLKQKVFVDVCKWVRPQLSLLVKYLPTTFQEVILMISAVDSDTMTSDEISLTGWKFNRGCLVQDFETYGNQFLHIFYRESSFMDILLAGSSFVLNVAKHIPGPHQSTCNALALPHQLLINFSCGIMYWVGLHSPTCDQIVDNVMAKPSIFSEKKTRCQSCPSSVSNICGSRHLLMKNT